MKNTSTSENFYGKQLRTFDYIHDRVLAISLFWTFQLPLQINKVNVFPV